jgi:hypothetical protein
MRTKVKSFETKEYNGKKSYTVTLENGVSGYLNAQGSDTIGEGNEVDYTLEVKKNKKGQDYNLLTVKLVSETQQKPAQTGTNPPPPPPPTNVKISPEFILSQKVIIICEVIRCVFGAFEKDKLDDIQVKAQINELTAEVFTTLDEFKG